MPNRTSQAAAPSLVEVLTAMGRDWRSLAEQAKASPLPQTDDCPKVVLTEKHWAHPIWDLFRLIEEATGIDRNVIERVAWRIDTPLGLAPLKRTQRPAVPVTDPDLADLPDDEPIPDVPDLRWVYPRLNECDVNGTTATILRRLEAKHPGALGAFGFSCQTEGIPATDPSRTPESIGSRPANDATAQLTAIEKALILYTRDPNKAFRQIAREAGADRGETPAVKPAVAASETQAALELTPGGFTYRGKVCDLTGRPRDMLSELLTARDRRCTATDLRKALKINDEAVSYPEQVVKDVAADLRKALRRAVTDSGQSCQNPLPSKGRGEQLTYILAMP